MIRLIYMLTLLLSTLSFPSLATGLTWLDPKFVETAFYEVALKNEYSKGQKSLTKWNQPLKIWIQHKVTDKDLHQELVELHLAHLSTITGLNITIVNQKSEANIKWVFTSESTWYQDAKNAIGIKSTDHLKTAICTAGYQMNHRGEIVKAGIAIPVDLARERGKLLACIVEEITQVLGLPNDSELAYPSIFNDQTPNDLLSPLDVVLLKLLYEPELKIGLTKTQLKPTIQRILKRYQAEGVLQNASKVSTQAPLYQLVGY
ncbi:DUF2927 domain-containing protein [Vibrio kagoshimensis]|uniref:DUF2927 domain-containing protein n=1 Tax=Vibrio kagoshimensis TaxID=2910244 RepID=UPI003D1A5A75